VLYYGSDRERKIKKIFKIPENYHLDLVVALGYPVEKPVLEEGEGKYWRDEKGVLHIPKRPLKKILRWNKF